MNAQIREQVRALIPIRRQTPDRWEFQDDYGCWHPADSEDRAIILGAHDRLITAQRYGNADDYRRWLAICWQLPCPASVVQEWEEKFRPAYSLRPKDTVIPDPRRAPQQAIRWGMDPELARSAKARARLYAEIAESFSFRVMTAYSVLRHANRHMTEATVAEVTGFLDRCCQRIRRAGLAEAFGLEGSHE